MNDTISSYALFQSSRGRVYLLWALIVAVGFTWTHYYQNPNINIVWTVLSIVGFVYMYKVMPLRMSQMKQIYAAWLVPIVTGMVFSVIAARTDLLPSLLGYLGAFWLLVMAVGFLWNGLVDKPGLWYYVAAAANALAAGLIYFAGDVYLITQYLIAAVVSTWAMALLWIYRSDT